VKEPAADPDEQVFAFLREAFEANFEVLRLESGRGLSADGKQFAWNQVQTYWRRLRDVARSITNTEVRLTLPNQRTPKGRPYTIEGIVDIVREEGYTVMYDIKSHDAEYIRQNREMYKQQLDVYAHIWQNLRGLPLNETAIIATHFPKAVADALESGDEGQLAFALGQWNPLVPLEFDPSAVESTIAEFGSIVDAIEDGVFEPRSVQHLDAREGSTQQRFATAVCRNCDARYSCSSYRQWALGSTSRIERTVRRYFEDTVPEEDAESVRAAYLQAAPSVSDLEADFG